jgi:hypothetical protein
MDIDIQIRDDVETGQQPNVTRRGEIEKVDDPLSEDKTLGASERTMMAWRSVPHIVPRKRILALEHHYWTRLASNRSFGINGNPGGHTDCITPPQWCGGTVTLNACYDKPSYGKERHADEKDGR